MSNKVTIYGIRNCDTMKKAFAWLDARGIAYDFHDYKKTGLDENTLREWVNELGWESLLNTRGMMWRKLPDSAKVGIDRERAIRLMLDTPSIIKRPVLDTGSRRYLGFSEPLYNGIFG
jgi:Spx/MgsR family transcriptional regulator